MNHLSDIELLAELLAAYVEITESPYCQADTSDDMALINEIKRRLKNKNVDYDRPPIR